MTKYQWTDWITHVPGQRLPAGSHGLFEFHGARRNGGVPYAEEGTVTPEMKSHGCWFETDINGRYCVLVRYKLRSIALEDEQSAERELELSHG